MQAQAPAPKVTQQSDPPVQALSAFPAYGDTFLTDNLQTVLVIAQLRGEYQNDPWHIVVKGMGTSDGYV
jgi:hypothetical protein|tara:strand:- start:6827 stop:7033 length:207 start_codon:yes stop_codon:yes gene_type:complete